MREECSLHVRIAVVQEQRCDRQHVSMQAPCNRVGTSQLMCAQRASETHMAFMPCMFASLSCESRDAIRSTSARKRRANAWAHRSSCTLKEPPRLTRRSCPACSPEGLGRSNHPSETSTRAPTAFDFFCEVCTSKKENRSVA